MTLSGSGIGPFAAFLRASQIASPQAASFAESEEEL